MKDSKLGVLLLNLGTPDQPTTQAIRRYLAEFLSDPRVVDIPRWLWLPVLYLFILWVRPHTVAGKYRKIWGRKDSPLRIIMYALAGRTERALQVALREELPGESIMVRPAMTYGSPGIRHSVDAMKQQGVTRYLFLPLFPQYANATVGACYDQVTDCFRPGGAPPFRFIAGYHDQDSYIHALANSVERCRRFLNSETLLLFSFHGIPRAQSDQGDPYANQCVRTAELVAHHLGLGQNQWRLSYQSRFGPAEWLTPYTSNTLARLPAEGIDRVLVICPGFATECLETLEEIKIMNREIFLNAGGSAFKYVKALNATALHVDVMKDLITEHFSPDEQHR